MDEVETAASIAALEQAVLSAGSQSELARRIGATQGTVWRWLNGKAPITPEAVLKVETATGVSRHDLRPDLYPRNDSAIERAA